jgi:hypothetical protein
MWRPIAASVLLALSGVSAARAAEAADDAGFVPGRPVVELFTSQGCSSCPPADRLMSSLAPHEAVVLAFHVDYWNHLGWTDPFSSPQASQRQRQYAAAFRSRSVYTPQAILNGTTEGEGSDARWLHRSLAAAASEPAGRFRGAARRTSDGHVEVTIEARRPAGVAAPFELLVALTESGLTTPVPRGENADRDLRNDHVVRRMVLAGALAPGRDGLDPVSLDLEVPADSRGRLRVVAFLQEGGATRLYGGASFEVDPKAVTTGGTTRR